MNKLLLALALAGTFCAPAGAADIAVSVSIGEPGFYGRLDIGGFPQPQLLYPQPVMVEPAPPGRPPIYLRVPPGHAKHWAQHCREYNACGERVYFVRDDWYSREYAPRYQQRRDDYRPPERPAPHQDRRDDRRDDPRNGYRDDDRGPGRGHGRDEER